MKYMGISVREKKKKEKFLFHICDNGIHYLFGLQLFMGACSSSDIIKRVAGRSVCVLNPYSFRVLIIWNDFL